MAEESILAAVSGIDANQTYLDSIANNIANSDTVGYKSEDVQFQDLLAEQIAGGSVPTATAGGVNPIAVGAGVRVGADSVNLSEGSLESTGQPTDVAIQGGGYLVVDDAGSDAYTRDGNLTIDGNGNLTTQDGGLIQGWQASSTGALNTNAPTTALTIPTGETIPAQATSTFDLGGNLPAWSGTGTAPVEDMTYNAYDSLGATVPVTLTFTGVAGSANTWTVAGTVPTPSGGTDNLWSTTAPPTVTFNPSTGEISTINNGTTNLTANSNGSYSLAVGTMPAGYTFPTGDTWSFTFPSPTNPGAVTQFASSDTLAIQNQDGYASGSLASFSIGTNGVITGSFSDGTTLALGQIALANFTNPSGLSDLGSGLYGTSPNSGQPQITTPGTGGAGTLLGGELEQSNVDLGQELTNLIDAQEAYDANTKVLTASQSVIQSLESVA